LKETLNLTQHFLYATQSLFLKKTDDEKPFTDGEIKNLEKMIKDTYVSNSTLFSKKINFSFKDMARSSSSRIFEIITN
jgi:hypothetical protein